VVLNAMSIIYNKIKPVSRRGGRCCGGRLRGGRHGFRPPSYRNFVKKIKKNRKKLILKQVVVC
jgi:hypothetical protein